MSKVIAKKWQSWDLNPAAWLQPSCPEHERKDLACFVGKEEEKLSPWVGLGRW